MTACAFQIICGFTGDDHTQKWNVFKCMVSDRRDKSTILRCAFILGIHLMEHIFYGLLSAVRSGNGTDHSRKATMYNVVETFLDIVDKGTITSF